MRPVKLQPSRLPKAKPWLVRMAGRPVGCLILTLGYSVEYGGRDGFIDDLYLVPEASGRGLGRRLLNFAFAEAAWLGIRTLHLEVEPAMIAQPGYIVRPGSQKPAEG